MSTNKNNTRTKILETTWKLMEQQNAQDVHMKDIAKAAGISRQAVYLHFASRAELLVATTIYMEEALNFEGRVQRWQEATSGVELLDSFVEFWGSILPDIYGVAKALIAVYDTDTAAAEAWNGRLGAIRQACHTSIKALAADGMLDDGWTIDTATDLFATILSVEQWEKLTGQCGWSTSEYIERTQLLVKRTFIRNGP